MVVPVPAQILKLPPRLPSRPRHTSPPPSTFRCTLRIPNVSTGRSDLQAFPRSFVSPLFSYSYKPLFPQLLYFHIHPNPPGCGVYKPPISLRTPCLCGKPIVFRCLPPLSPLCALFAAPFLCFQSLAASFAKTPGVGGSTTVNCTWYAARRRTSKREAWQAVLLPPPASILFCRR